MQPELDRLVEQVLKWIKLDPGDSISWDDAMKDTVFSFSIRDFVLDRE